MKKITQVSVTILLLIVGTAKTSTAETLVVGAGLTNTISIPSGEAIVIDFVNAFFPNYPIYQDQTGLTKANFSEGAAFAGPSSLTFTMPLTNSTVLTFRRIRSSELKTVILGPVTNTVIVPEKKSIRIYPMWGLGKIVFRTGIHSGSIPVSGASLGGRTHAFEFTGPLEVDFVGSEGTVSGHQFTQIFTYCILDGEIEVNPDGVIKAPPGTVKLQIERSNTLTNWSPATVQQVWTDDSSAFFRLRVEK